LKIEALCSEIIDDIIGMMNASIIDSPSAPGDPTQNTEVGTFGSYSGEITMTSKGRFLLIDLDQRQVEGPIQIRGSIELPVDSIYRVRGDDDLIRTTYVVENDQDRDLEIAVSRLLTYDLTSILEVGNVDANGRKFFSMKVYDKPPYPVVNAVLREGIVEDIEAEELTYFHGREARSLTTPHRPVGDGPMLRESHWDYPMGVIYWLERFKYIPEGIKHIASSKAFMRFPADIVASRIVDDITLVDEGSRAYYVKRDREAADSLNSFFKLLQYREKYFPRYLKNGDRAAPVSGIEIQ
jgi:hypothetical protein